MEEIAGGERVVDVMDAVDVFVTRDVAGVVDQFDWRRFLVIVAGGSRTSRTT